ncbi:nascent polypeptide-associated complex subunit alpha, muscle-specific form isoform X2 [Labrus mixtus]|uniref:nascent polypeptide-associated complex subunit alpha, muscle-specific form isoform X2 n=1 Tax=Labrus mixtus TaxID=508554 RepID=UPI0029C04173|nr:nascent polypeptide-associated complex subunit alpha, muscle-specific form isoform X2 [Labrus mixtus]
MASFSGDADGSTEDVPGRKKSKLKSLKTRLFGRGKRGTAKKIPKLSQSESDITPGKDLGSEEDLVCSQGMMSSRALSHDSIFLDDEVLKEAEQTRASSQENVQGRIKALQMKLQQQKMHLGPPPLVLPVRRPEDSEIRSDDDNLSSSPPEISTTSPQSSQPLSPIPKPSPTKYLLPTSSHPLPVSGSSNPSADESPSDFSAPAQLTPRLDTSAARHRMSVKPRKQRAGSKKKTGDADTDFSSNADTLNNIDHTDSDSDKEQQPCAQEEVTLETTQGETISPITSQVVPPKFPEVAPITSEVETKSMSLTSSQQDQTLPEAEPSAPPQVLRVKSHRTGNALSIERPHSCLLPSEVKDRRDGGFEIEVMCHDKRNTGTGAFPSTAGQEVVSRSSSVHQQNEGETESTPAIKRPTQGSGSFHFALGTAKNRDGERPRSGSFAGVLEKTEGRHRYEKKPIAGVKEREELRDIQARGMNSAMGRLRQDGAPQKSSSLPWDRKESLKKVELVPPSTSSAADTAAVKGEDAKEEVEKQEFQEDEGKTAFGVKLRTTSQLGRLRSESSSDKMSKAPVCEEQCNKQKVLEMSNNTTNKSIKMSTDISTTPVISGDLRLAGPTPSGLSSPVKKTPPPYDHPHITSTEVHTASTKVETSSIIPKKVETVPPAPQEPPPTPQSTSSEVSWMTLAMAKTKSIQQLFNRFPRDFTGAATQPQAQPQAQPTSPAPTPAAVPIQTQTVKMQQSTTPPEAAKQPSIDAIGAEAAQSEAHVVKPSLVATQQKTSMASPVKLAASREPQASKQTSQQPQTHRSTTPSAAVKINTQTTQSPLHSATKTQTTSQFAAQGSTTQSLAQFYLNSGQQQQQQPPWSNQLNSASPALTLVSTPCPATSPPDSASGGGERETAVQDKEVAPLSVSERAAFLEKRAERITSPSTKGMF